MLSRLDIQHVRNLRQVRLTGLQSVNVFHGNNGSGKTSILEAIHLLAMARSFRGSIKSLITHGEQACTVYGLNAGSNSGNTVSLGVMRNIGGEVAIKISGSPVRSVARLVEQLPVQVINSASFDLLTGAPAARRQYLDWGVFHVEQRFLSEWQRFQRCIKQRNRLLRHGKMSDSELVGWTRELALAGESIDRFRQGYVERLLPRVVEVAAQLAPELQAVELRYRRGWDSKLSYEEVLAHNLEIDKQQGYTHAGPQRADVRVTVADHLAADMLSRGQQKLLVCALKLAQGQILAEQGRVSDCTYLVDDLPSELDREHNRYVCRELATMGAQVFLTCIEGAEVRALWPGTDNLAMFHVEHGQIQRQE